MNSEQLERLNKVCEKLSEKEKKDVENMLDLIKPENSKIVLELIKNKLASDKNGQIVFNYISYIITGEPKIN